MVIKSLYMNNFRNYENEKIIFSDEFNYIFGNNGVGKTNILEAMTFLSFGKSFLNSKESDCILLGKDNFFIEGQYQNEFTNEYLLSLNYYTGKKFFSLNKERVNGFSGNVFGKFPLVYLTPHSINITYGNPSERRKFFDIIFSQINPLYLDYLKKLNKILKLKNTLLKESNLNISQFEFNKLLDSYNELMADISAEIIYRRKLFLAEFEKYLIRNYKHLSTENELPIITYSSTLNNTDTLKDSPDSQKENIKDIFKEMFDEIKSKEISRKLTLIGPHRDDYIFLLKRKTLENKEQLIELKSFASQGEHKTFLIALKLSEYNFIKDKLGTNPILLLDDVMSELDSIRVKKLMSHIPNFSQVFVTSTELNHIDEFKNFLNSSVIKIFKVENNNVKSIN